MDIAGPEYASRSEGMTHGIPAGPQALLPPERNLLLRSLGHEALRHASASYRIPQTPADVIADDMEAALLSQICGNGPNEAASDDLMQRIEASGLDRAAILTCLSDVAARLGRGWVEDRLEFADVSIGSARLQRLVNRIAARRPAPNRGGARKSLTILTPGGEQHLLGTTIFAGLAEESGWKASWGLPRRKLRCLVACVGWYNERLKHAISPLIAAIRNKSEDAPFIVFGGEAATRHAGWLTSLGTNYVANGFSETIDILEKIADDLFHETRVEVGGVAGMSDG